MVKVVQKPFYACEICNSEYRKQEEAERCGQLPTTDFKYSIGDRIRIEVPLIERDEENPSVSF